MEPRFCLGIRPLRKFEPRFPFADVRLTPHYPAKSPLEDVLRLVAPGSDGYVTEKYAFEIESLLKQWGQALKTSAHDLSVLAKSLDPSIQASSLVPSKEIKLRTGDGIDIVKREVCDQRRSWTRAISPGAQSLAGADLTRGNRGIRNHQYRRNREYPLTVRLNIRYGIVAVLNDERRQERVGSWRTEWCAIESEEWKARKWEAGEETVAVARGPMFIDVTRAGPWRDGIVHKSDASRLRLLAYGPGWRMRN